MERLRLNLNQISRDIACVNIRHLHLYLSACDVHCLVVRLLLKSEAKLGRMLLLVLVNSCVNALW